MTRPERARRPIQGERIKTTDELYILYDQLNYKYFNGELPEADKVEIQWSNRLTRISGRCRTIHKNKVPCRFIITLSTHYIKKFPEELEQVMNHEMIHVKLRMSGIKGHGEPFKAEIERIKALGGIVERYAIERAKSKEPKWFYLCPNCDSHSKLLLRRWAYGGKRIRCKCGSQFVEFFDGKPYVPPEKNKAI